MNQPWYAAVAMAAGTDQFIGRDILDGQFRILEKIGSGGMGSVYKASQPSMNRTVAVKILHPKLTNRRDLVSRFRREASAMSHLNHPNTVKVFNYGEIEDGSLFIVMEFLEGRNLHQTVRTEGPMLYRRALPILIQVCAALGEAHSKGIIHRDLKPENIFLCKDPLGKEDYAKVLDFGLAKVTEREMNPGSIVLTQEGMIFGTPEFMSPEQAQGKPLDPSSDIYSLAAILYEAITGKLPFNAKTAMEFIQHHVTSKPIDLNARVHGLSFPVDLAAALAKAMAKKPADRFRTAEEFANALREVLTNAGIDPNAGGSNEPVHAVVEKMPTAVPQAPLVAPSRSYVPLVIGVAVGGLVLGILVTILVVVLLFPDKPPERHQNRAVPPVERVQF